MVLLWEITTSVNPAISPPKLTSFLEAASLTSQNQHSAEPEPKGAVENKPFTGRKEVM